MARHNRTGRTKGRGRHIQITEDMMRTAAWGALDCHARAAYVELLRRYNGRNNGHISYSVRELASALRVGRTRAHEALQALQHYGFVAPVERSGFNRKDRQATIWRLTEHRCDRTGQPATADFRTLEI